MILGLSTDRGIRLDNPVVVSCEIRTVRAHTKIISHISIVLVAIFEMCVSCTVHLHPKPRGKEGACKTKIIARFSRI